MITEFFKDNLPLGHLLKIVLGSIVAYIVFLRIKYEYLKRKFKAVDAPLVPNSGLLFSRNWVMMLKAKRDGSMLEMIWDIVNDAGKNFYVRIGGVPLLVTVDPDNIKALLATQFNDFALGFRNAHFKPLLGDGIFTLDGAGWKHSRALLRPNFSREKVAHVQSLEGHLQCLAKHIQKHKGSAFDIQEYFYRFTVDTATEFLFGESIYGLRDESIGESSPVDFPGRAEFYDSFTISQEYLTTRAWSQNLYFIINSPEFRRCNKNVHKFAKHYVDLALKATPEEIEERSRGGYVFLYELVKETRDPQVLQNQLLNIMIAGRDTTAGLLSFTMYELSRNPEVWEKLKDDIYRNFGSGDDARVSDISFESLKRCEYLRNVINETLRLYPNVPINYRVATKDTTFPSGGGPDGKKPIFLRKGRVIGYVISHVHRNPEYYGKDADVFRPERWEDKSLKPGWAYLPFNGGPRICLGQQFALTEASYVITRLAQMFPNLISRDRTGDYPPKMNSQLTLSLRDGSWVSMY